MSYLNLPNGIPDFTQAVISFWFRAPLATLQKAKDAYATFSGPHVPSALDAIGVGDTTMAGIVPLMTFGRPQSTDFYGAPPLVGSAYTFNRYFWGGEFRPGPWTVDITATFFNTIAPSSLAVSNWPMPPCYIGVECVPSAANNDNGDLYTLRIHLQMDKTDTANKLGLVYSLPSASTSDPWKEYSTEGFSAGGFHGPGFENDGAWGSYVWTNDGHHVTDGYTFPLADHYFPAFWPPNATTTVTSNSVDVSNTDLSPEVFELGGKNSGRSTDLPPLQITPDHWHHVLFSIDLSNEISTHGLTWAEANVEGLPTDPASNTTSAVRAWIALDDVNIDRDGMSPLWPNGPTRESPGYPDPNALLSIHAYGIAQRVTEPVKSALLVGDSTYLKSVSNGLVRPKFSYTSAGVPSADAPLGFPAAPDQVDSIYNIELAEFQIFTGITLDLSDVSQRRFFIDDDGKPVPPDQKASGSQGQSGSIEGLGQRPDILLHGSKNWVKGMNTGSLGRDFTPTALITKYKPDPSLNGPQGPT